MPNGNDRGTGRVRAQHFRPLVIVLSMYDCVWMLDMVVRVILRLDEWLSTLWLLSFGGFPLGKALVGVGATRSGLLFPAVVVGCGLRVVVVMA